MLIIVYAFWAVFIAALVGYLIGLSQRDRNDLKHNIDQLERIHKLQERIEIAEEMLVLHNPKFTGSGICEWCYAILEEADHYPDCLWVKWEELTCANSSRIPS